MKMKKLTLAFLLVMTALSTSFIHGQEMGGELTPEISWKIANGTLYISGNGIVPTTMIGRVSAWNKFRSNFNSVVIEDGITVIGRYVFNGHKNITSLSLGKNVKDITPQAFSGCKKLAVIEVNSAIPPDINSASFYGVKLKKTRVIIPSGTKVSYQDDPIWSTFGTIEESSQVADQPSPSVTLSQPCTISLKRSWNYVGGAIKSKVYLNGIEQEKLGNGNTILLTTDRDKNMLHIQTGKKVISVRRFDATAGGEIRIDYSMFSSYIKIVEEHDEE